MTDFGGDNNRRWDWVGDILEGVAEIGLNLLWMLVKGCAQAVLSLFDGL